jgi:6-phosphogluconolactonase (cycloisomerase 2 family)
MLGLAFLDPSPRRIANTGKTASYGGLSEIQFADCSRVRSRAAKRLEQLQAALNFRLLAGRRAPYCWAPMSATPVRSAAVAALLACLGPACGPSNKPPPAQLPVPRFAYVVDSRDAISGFTIEPSGQLRSNGYAIVSPTTTSAVAVTSALAPALAVNPLGFIYAIVDRTAATGPQILTAAINGKTGVLTPMTAAWPPGIPLEILGHPSGKFMYVMDANSNIQAGDVNAANGALTPVGVAASTSSIGSVRRIAVDPKGAFLIASGRGGALPNYIDQVGTIAIDQASGAPTGSWRRLTLPFEPGAVAVHPEGRCGAAIPFVPDAKVATFGIAANGTPTNAVGTATGVPVVDVAIDPKGTAVFLLDGAGVGAFPITDSATCSLGAKVGPVPLRINAATRLSVDPSGKFIYASSPQFNSVSVLTIGPGASLTDAGHVTSRPTLTGFAPVFTTAPTAPSYLPFLYVANYGSNNISIFSIGITGGGLTPVGTRTSLGTGPFAIAVDPWSRFAYVANRDSGNIAVFTINQSTGELIATAPPVAVGAKPVALSVDPSGRFLFVANNGSNNVRAFTINQSNGQLTPPAVSTFPMAPQPTSMLIEPSGTTLYLATVGGTPAISGFTIDQTAGLLGGTGPSPSSVVTGYTALGVDVQGDYLFAGVTVGSVPASNFATTFLMNLSLGNIATPTGTSVIAGRQPISVAVDPLGRFVYTANNIDPGVSVFSINRAGSTLTPGMGLNFPLSAPPKSPRAVLVDPSGRFLYLAEESGSVFAFSINQTTGALTTIGSVTAGTNPFALGIARLPI